MKLWIKIGLVLMLCCAVVIVVWHRVTSPQQAESGSTTSRDSVEGEERTPGNSVDAAIQTTQRLTEPVPAPSAAAQTSQASSRDLPDRFKLLLEQKHAYPSVELLGTFGPEDEAMLLDLYADETELTNKLALTWILAGVGGNKAANALRRTVIADYGGRVLSDAERTIMRDTMSALVFLSERSDVAYGFLAEASSEEYWEGARKWQASSSSAEDYSNKRFADLAIKYLGASLKPEAYEKLMEYKLTDPRTIRNTSPLVDARFYHDLAQARGADALVKMVLAGKSFYEFQEWMETDVGKDWYEWGTTAIREHSAEE